MTQTSHHEGYSRESLLAMDPVLASEHLFRRHQIQIVNGQDPVVTHADAHAARTAQKATVASLTEALQKVMSVATIMRLDPAVHQQSLDDIVRIVREALA